ncbi:MAG: hypothetical protein ACREAW_08985, partial [Nitrososphaera sp.]
MAKAIKGLHYAAGATVVLLMAMVFAPTAGTAVAQMDDTPRAYALRGQISNVQLDGDGNPEWIQSGIWVMRVTPG